MSTAAMGRRFWSGDFWLDGYRSLRDRLLLSPGFQNWATAFPLTRPIARHRAKELFDLCAGFVYSQILLSCVKLNLHTILSERAQTLAELQIRLSLPANSAERLLRAAVALKIAERRSRDRFGLGPLGAALVANPGIAEMIEHHAALYADLRDPVALLRGEPRETALSGYWPYASHDDPAELSAEKVSAYCSLMTASQPMIAREILDAYPLGRHRCLLDVGGGEGAFLSAVAGRFPDLQLMLFDLPAVAARAQGRFIREGLAAKARAIGGSLWSDPLPEGADIISLVRVIHDHDDDKALQILHKVRQALTPEGTLLLAEPMSDTAGAEVVGDAYFGFYLLAMGSGRPRKPAELKKLLQSSGFNEIRLLATRTPMLTRLMSARVI